MYFADMSAASNENLLRLMRRKCIREHFLPSEDSYYKKASVALDVYGLGRTIQYMLTAAQIHPALARKEEHQLKKMISKCLKYKSKKQIQNISEIRNYIPNLSKQNPHSKKYIWISLLAAVLLAVCAVPVYFLLARQNEKNNENEHIEEVRENSEMHDKEDRIKECLDLALNYFLELEDYEKTCSVLDEISEDSDLAAAFKKVAEALVQENVRRMKAVLPLYLEELEKQAEKEYLTEKERLPYQLCIIQGYGIMDDSAVAEEVLRLGEVCMGQEESMEDDWVLNVKERMARAYELSGQKKLAAEQYQLILEMEKEEAKRESCYKKIIMLYEACGQKDMALDACVQGIEELRESEELKVLHLNILCSDRENEDICIQTIREYLQEDPGLQNNEEFKKLLVEYDIHMKGEIE